MNLDEKIAHLRQARQIIEKGWCKGMLDDYNGNHCAMGAINKAVFGHAVAGGGAQVIFDDLVEGLPKQVGVLGPEYSCRFTIARWNNDEATKKEDVLAHFDETIRRLEAERISELAKSAREALVVAAWEVDEMVS